MEDGIRSRALQSERREVSWHKQVIRASAEHIMQRTPGLGEVAISNCIRHMLNVAINSLELVALENLHTGRDYCRPPCSPWSKESRGMGWV